MGSRLLRSTCLGRGADMPAGVQGCSAGPGAKGCTSAPGWIGCGGAPCIPGPLACPDAIGSMFTVNLPATVTWGSCSPPATCTPSLSSVYVTEIGTSCLYLIYGGCASGWTLESVSLSNDVDDDGCAVWAVRVSFLNASEIVYEKRRTGAQDSPIGTYSLVKFSPACTGATADAYITVSPGPS